MKRGRLIVAAIVIAVVAAFLFWPRRAPHTEVNEPASVAPEAPARSPAHKKTLLHLSPAPAQATQNENRESTLSGRVISRVDGSGIDGAELTFARGEASHSIITSAGGVFRFRAPAPGDYQLASVSADHYLPFEPAWGSSPLVFNARAGTNISDIVISLEPEVIIAGKVIDPNHAPVSGASISVLIPGVESASLTSDERGTFALTAPAGALILVEHAGFAPIEQQITDAIYAKRELTIALALARGSAPIARASISGKVVDGSGNGLPSVLVRAGRSDRDRFAEELDWWTAKSALDGSFQLSALASGKYDLEASSPGLVSARAENVEAGAKDVVLRLHEDGGSIRGQVTAGAGAVPSFIIVLSIPRGRIEEITVGTFSFLDAEGRFSIGPFEPGPYRVRAVAHSWSASDARDVDVSARKTSVADFRLSKGATVIGAVKNSSTAAPIAGARIELEGQYLGGDLPIEIDSVVLTGADGSFSLAGLAPGLRSISAEAKGYDSRIVSRLQVTEDAVIGPIDIALTPLASPDAAPKRELTGIGAALAAEGDVLVIGQVIAGGGAAEAGLNPGDRILAIDGQSVGELDGLNGAVQRIRGPEGSTVLLTIQRASGGEVKISVFRRKIRA